MRSRLMTLATLGSVALGAAIAYWLWPSSRIIAPEKTGEIGFAGIVVAAKYFHYVKTMVLAAAIGAGVTMTVGAFALHFVDVRFPELADDPAEGQLSDLHEQDQSK